MFTSVRLRSMECTSVIGDKSSPFVFSVHHGKLVFTGVHWCLSVFIIVNLRLMMFARRHQCLMMVNLCSSVLFIGAYFSPQFGLGVFTDVNFLVLLRVCVCYCTCLCPPVFTDVHWCSIVFASVC